MLYYTAGMKKKKFLKHTAEIAEAHRIRDGARFRLKDFDPGETRSVKSEKAAKELLKQGVEMLRDLQERLYAQDRWGVLILLQGLDASGKDGTIRHVMSGVNPQGCTVSSF